MDSGCGAVVEDPDRPVALASRVVLPCEAHAFTEPVIAPLAAEPPEDSAGLPADLVDGLGIACRNEEVAVHVDGDRVDVEVVERGRRLARRLRVRLTRRDVVDAMPVEEHPSACEIELLHTTFRVASF